MEADHRGEPSSSFVRHASCVIRTSSFGGMMRKVNTAKQKMLAGQPAYGYSLGMASPIAAEALAQTGIDWILLDNQHGSFGPDSTITTLIARARGPAHSRGRAART